MGRFRSFLLLLIPLALYARTLSSVPFLVDDITQIVRNPAVTEGVRLDRYFDPATTSIRDIFNVHIYRPLRTMALRLIARVAGVHSWAFGLANLLCYAATVLLLGRLAELWTGDPAAAFWAAALWAAASVHVEPVVYRSALGDQLSALLELGALLLGLRAVREARWPLSLLSLLLALGSLLAKEMAVTELALLALLLWGLGLLRRRSALLLIAGHALITLGYLALRTFAVKHIGQGNVTLSTIVHGLREAPNLLVHYVGLCLRPWGHSMAYRVDPPSPIGALLITVALLVALGLLWRIHRPTALGLVWFIVALLPVLHLVPLQADLADRFTLVPSMGLALSLASTLAVLPPLMKRTASWATPLLLLVLAGGTISDQRWWASELRLWVHAVEVEPRAGLGHANLGAALGAKNRLQEALRELVRSEELGYLNPDVLESRVRVLHKLGRTDEVDLTMSRWFYFEPESPMAHLVYSAVLFDRHLFEPAHQELLRARELEKTPGRARVLDQKLAEFAKAAARP